MIPPKEGWHKFSDGEDKEAHYRKWGLSLSAPMIFYNGHYSNGIVSCKVLGYQGSSMAVIQIDEELHCIHGEYLCEMQPKRRKAEGIPTEYVVLDTETTSKYMAFAEIIEVAAIKYKDGEKVDTFSTLIKPIRKIPDSASEVNGITDADVTNAPSWDTVKNDFFSFIGNLPIVGHNITYDINVIQHQSNTWIDNPCIDTMQRAKKSFPGRKNYKLESLKQDLALGDQISHRALADCETTNALLWACERT